MPLDENLAALLTEDVSYQAKATLDANGQDVWSDPVTLKCYPTLGARQIQRRDGTIYVSNQTLTFDANDETVQGFKLGDRFTTVGIAGGAALEAVSIEPSYSPGPDLGAPMEQWLVEVAL